MSAWVTVHASDLSREEPVRPAGHSFIHISKHVTWPPFCRSCGHVALKNEISRLITKIGCAFQRDERFRKWASQ